MDNWKGALQELINAGRVPQIRRGQPEYKHSQGGIMHQPVFRSSVTIGDETFHSTIQAKKKVEAEQDAARIAYQTITGEMVRPRRLYPDDPSLDAAIKAEPNDMGYDAESSPSPHVQSPPPAAAAAQRSNYLVVDASTVDVSALHRNLDKYFVANDVSVVLVSHGRVDDSLPGFYKHWNVHTVHDSRAEEITVIVAATQILAKDRASSLSILSGARYVETLRTVLMLVNPGMSIPLHSFTSVVDYSRHCLNLHPPPERVLSPYRL